MIDSLNTWTFDSQDAPAPPPAGAPVPAPAPAANTTTGTAAPAAQQPQGNFLVQMVPFIIIFFLFYMLLIRPQRRQQKEREKMITALKKNDHVITSGGICGIVDRIKDNDVYLRVDEKSEVRLRVIRSSIAVVEKVSGAEDTPEKK